MRSTSEFDDNDNDDDGIMGIAVGGGLGGLLGALLGEGGASKLAHVLAMKAYNDRVKTALDTMALAHMLVVHATPEQKRETLEKMAQDWSSAGDEKQYPGDEEVMRRMKALADDSFIPAKIDGEKVLIGTLFDATLYNEFPCCEHVRAQIKERCDEAALMAAKSPDGKEHRAN